MATRNNLIIQLDKQFSQFLQLGKHKALVSADL